MKVAEGNCRIKMHLEIEDLSKVEPYKEEQESTWSTGLLSMMYSRPTVTPKPDNIEELDDYLTLNMLGFLLKDKVQHREELLKEIESKL